MDLALEDKNPPPELESKELKLKFKNSEFRDFVSKSATEFRLMRNFSAHQTRHVFNIIKITATVMVLNNELLRDDHVDDALGVHSEIVVRREGDLASLVEARMLVENPYLVSSVWAFNSGGGDDDELELGFEEERFKRREKETMNRNFAIVLGRGA
ncbi:hypothetical protein U1Q18_019646 [Sarracenia purpurea var. burkii]